MKGRPENWPLQSFDARDWANAFCDIFEEKTGTRPDEGWMISWFANALMRGYDEHRWTTKPELTPSDWLPSETLFAFMGWLTSRREAVTLSASHDAAIACDLIAQFMKRHSLAECRDGWEKLIVPAPATEQPESDLRVFGSGDTPSTE